MSTNPNTGADASTLQAIIEELEATITALDSRLRILEQSAPASDSHTPGEQYAPLADWVTWLRETFSLDELTDTWDTIPGVSQELQALHAAWRHAHSPDGTPGPEATQWHEARIRCQERIDDLTARHRRHQIKSV